MRGLFQPVVLTMPRYRHGGEQHRCHTQALEDILVEALLQPTQRSLFSSGDNRSCHTGRQCPEFQPRWMRRISTNVKKPWIRELDMSGFNPGHIQIKVDGNSLIVHARKEVKQGENFDVKERKRVITIPDGVDKSRIKCHINRLGHFVIKGTFECDTNTSVNYSKSQKPTEMETEQKPTEMETEQKSTEIEAKQKSTEIEAKQKSTEMEAKQKSTEMEAEQIEKQIDSSAEHAGGLNEEKTEVYEESRPSDEYIVSEVTDDSDVESDKTSVMSLADFIVNTLAGDGEQKVQGLRSESPIPFEDFVILADGKDIDDAPNVDTEKNYEEQLDSSKESSEVAVVDGNKSFNVKLNLKDYPSDDISVRCKDNTLIVDAKRDWKDGDMLRSQSLHRMYQLPENAEKSEARACVDGEGMFSITVPITEKQPDEEIDIIVEQE